ncbi:MAG: shikimate dehydrogenase [Pontiellaceae bacterium]|nr:shikimate dehydrogenase [Pontiellaceae bacterium]
MSANYKEELVGVFGYPVAENPTVVMQAAAFEALKLNWRYLTIEVLPNDLEAAMNGLRALNMRGVNLTIPHKVEVLKYLDEVSPAAALMGAVNTVVRKGDRLIGENTDGKGFLRALKQDAQMDPCGKKVVVLGAGGAARAITVELALAGAEQITIVNRSAERGRILTNLLNTKTSVSATFEPWERAYAVPPETDILINATSIGLPPNADEKPQVEYDSILPSMLVCDVIPAPTTPFLSEAKACGSAVLDGLGMLVYQGAIGFALWTGEEAPVEVMHQALSRALC